MSRLTSDIEHRGWRIGVGFAGAAAGASSFHAAYTGDVFGRPERGVLAAMARAHPLRAGDAGSAAAQIVVHEFAEGYFSAVPTLGPRRAAGQALTVLNDWLLAQLRHGPSAGLAPVSLSALLFNDAAISVMQVGCCPLFRVRRNAVTPLLNQPPHPDPAAGPSLRAIGQTTELVIDYTEEAAENGDRYVLLSFLGAAQFQAAQAVLAQGGDANTLARRLNELLAQDAAAAGAAAAMVLDIIERPAAATDNRRDLETLPLRPPPREGDVWDGFTIGRTLYRGRYTMVVAAHDTVHNRQVALKIPLPAMLQDQVFAAGFMREAWIGATVRSANIARYLDIPAERRRSLYLALPLYQGETLESRLLRAPPVALPEGIGIALKLCEAVQDLAAIQVVHRDLKPDNVMLLEGNQLRLLDLGLAYLPGIDLQDAVKPGGTLRYMAPELINGGQAGPRSEVYALAVTLYRMFAGGAYPFGQREKLPLQRLRPDLPGWLGRALQDALAPIPAKRFADAASFATALQRGLISNDDNQPPAAPAVSPLRLWQAATLILAAALLFMLWRAAG